MPTIIMPKMGDAMEEGTLLKWLKNVGDEVEVGEPIAEIETDKVSLEIEAEESGVLTATLVAEGDTVPIGTPIANIGEASEVGAAAESAPAATQAPVAAQPAANGHAAAEREVAQPAAVPAGAAQVQSQTPVPAQGGGNGAATAAPNRAPGERLRASPLVKRLAAEHGIDLSNVAGTGPGGRIVKDDITPYLTGAQPIVQPAAAPTQAPAVAPTPAPATALQPVAAAAPAGRPAPQLREMSRIRRTTGRRMAESKQTAPHFYVSTVVDMAPAMAFREQVNGQVDDASKVTYNDLILKAASLALRQYPNLNASLEGDQLYDHPNIDVNMAIAIDGGLIAPFVPDTDQKSLGTIARMAKDLANRARTGGLKPEEFQGGTFTVSNLGMFDVDDFIAVINPPQAAILAIGSIREQPVVENGELTVGHRMKITLAADHRVTDGAEVAKFLASVKGYLQNPLLLALS